MTDQDKKLSDFKKDLKELLKKHEASIGFTYDDCVDICGESISVCFRAAPLKDHKLSNPLSDAYWVSFGDLEEND